MMRTPEPTPPPPVPPAGDAARVDDPLALARAAEHDGKLELAIARYLESYDAHADPETLFRIAELYERLGRASDAEIYFQRYLDRAPGAHDRDAVIARLDRLRATPAPVRVDTSHHERPARQAGHCHCVVTNNPHFPSGEWACHHAQPPLCYCRAPHSDVGLCPTPLAPCVTKPCTTSANGVGYTCSDPQFDRLHAHATPDAECTGYLAGGPEPQVAVTGSYNCSVCAVFPREPTALAALFVYDGTESAPCTGIASDGEAVTGELRCEAE